ncbi:MAG: galactosyltransferase-related protein [Nonlabens sp.]
MSTAITIHYDREQQLNNMLRGLAKCSKHPEEVLIINMGPQPKIHRDYGLNIQVKQIEGDDSARLPIGEARNMGAQLASHDHLHFLDVDCIPGHHYLQDMTRYLYQNDGLVMGTPRYLYEDPKPQFSCEDLYSISSAHHKRPRVEQVQKCDDPGMFWSLCFSITKQTFNKLGGFDSNFQGYGGEDTDLSFRCKEQQVPFFLAPCEVYHQQHGFYKPPVDKIDSIVENCNYFYSKWNRWPMDKHLKAFQQRGYIDWSQDQTAPIKIIKRPDTFNMEQFYVNDMPYA